MSRYLRKPIGTLNTYQAVVDYTQSRPTKGNTLPPQQLSFDNATTDNIHSEIKELRKEIADLRSAVNETPELIKDLVEQMHAVLSALDDLTP